MGLQASAQKPAIKIGVADDYSGSLAAQGRDLAQAVKVFFGEKNWEVAGRKIEAYNRRYQTGSATALTKTKKLVLDDKVHLLIGYHGTGDTDRNTRLRPSTKHTYDYCCWCSELTRPLKSPLHLSSNIGKYPIRISSRGIRSQTGLQEGNPNGDRLCGGHQAGLVCQSRI